MRKKNTTEEISKDAPVDRKTRNFGALAWAVELSLHQPDEGTGLKLVDGQPAHASAYDASKWLRSAIEAGSLKPTTYVLLRIVETVCVGRVDTPRFTFTSA